MVVGNLKKTVISRRIVNEVTADRVGPKQASVRQTTLHKTWQKHIRFASNKAVCICVNQVFECMVKRPGITCWQG